MLKKLAKAIIKETDPETRRFRIIKLIAMRVLKAWFRSIQKYVPIRDFMSLMKLSSMKQS